MAPPPGNRITTAPASGSPQKIFINQLRDEFIRRLNQYPKAQEFSHPTLFEIAQNLFVSGRKGICALGKLLEAEAWWDNTRLMSREEKLFFLLDVTQKTSMLGENPAAKILMGEGAQCYAQFQEFSVMIFPALSDEEQFFLLDLPDPLPLSLKHSLYFINEGAKAATIAQALLEYQSALIISPNSPVPFAYERICNLGLLVAEAEKYVDLWLHFDPRSIDALGTKAVCRQIHKDYNKAIIYFNKAVSIAEPKFWEHPLDMEYKEIFIGLLFGRSKAHMECRQYSNAKEDLERIIGLCPEYPEIIKAYFLYAEALQCLFRSTEALAALYHASKSPYISADEKYLTIVKRALILLDREEKDRAIELLKKVYRGETEETLLRLLEQFRHGNVSN